MISAIIRMLSNLRYEVELRFIMELKDYPLIHTPGAVFYTSLPASRKQTTKEYNTMKLKLTTILASLVCLALASTAYCEERADKMNHVMMKDGKMMMMMDGKMTMMDKDMMMKNGSKVMMDGKVMMKDGTSMMMKEGQMMSMDGMMTPSKP